MYIYTHSYVYVCMCVCMYVYIYIYIYVCTYVCMYVCYRYGPTPLQLVSSFHSRRWMQRHGQPPSPMPKRIPRKATARRRRELPRRRHKLPRRPSSRSPHRNGEMRRRKQPRCPPAETFARKMDSAGGSCLSTPAAIEKCSGARCLVLEVLVFEDTEKRKQRQQQ